MANRRRYRLQVQGEKMERVSEEEEEGVGKRESVREQEKKGDTW